MAAGIAAIAAWACLHCGAAAKSKRESCERCGGYKTIVRAGGMPRTRGRGPVHAREVRRRSVARAGTGSGAWDRVLGGGLACPSSVLLGGSPGAGKSSWTAAIGDRVAEARGGEALYLSAEMPADLVVASALRVGRELGQTWIWGTEGGSAWTEIGTLVREVRARRPAFVALDSIQQVYAKGAVGTDASLREVVRRMLEAGSEVGAVVWLIAQGTKDDCFAGPYAIQHDVDAVIELREDRVLCRGKNRHGRAPASERFEAGEGKTGAPASCEVGDDAGPKARPKEG